jgi:hypothetical protein
LSEFWLSATGTPWSVVSMRPLESARTRSSGAIVLFCPIGGPPLPTLSEPFISVTVLDPTIGSRETTNAPLSGSTALSGSNSFGLLVLNGIAAASCWAPTYFAVRSSVELGGSGAAGLAGPLTVARLLRLTDVGRTDFDFADRRVDLAMSVFSGKRMWDETSGSSDGGHSARNSPADLRHARCGCDVFHYVQLRDRDGVALVARAH